MHTGDIQNALPHFLNFVHYSGNPTATLATLQQSMPAPLFNLIYQGYMAMRMQAMKVAERKAGKKDEPEVD